MEDQVQAIKERQDSFEAKVDMYMNMMNQQRAEDREEMRALNTKIDTAIRHIQNLSIVTMVGVGAMTLAVGGMVIAILMKD